MDGTADGEKSLDELFGTAIASGAAALNIIPDRNYTPGVQDQKLKNLYDVVEMAEKHHFPVIVGTEMNSPGNKFVDSFATADSVLQRECGLGYLSTWAKKAFPTVSAKNEFYERLGRELQPAREDQLGRLTAQATPDQILASIY